MTGSILILGMVGEMNLAQSTKPLTIYFSGSQPPCPNNHRAGPQK